MGANIHGSLSFLSLINDMVTFRKIKVIAVDFDSTVVKDEWPWKGEDVPGCVMVLKKLLKAGHRLILLTQREHVAQGDCPDVLQIALDWFAERDIRLWAVNDNPDADRYFYRARKVYADLYIDDHCVGIPLIPYTNRDGDSSPYVDWNCLDTWFKDHRYY